MPLACGNAAPTGGRVADGCANRFKALEDELNQYLAGEYGIDIPARHSHESGNPESLDSCLRRNDKYQKWLTSHKPFHWFIEFYGIIQKGGFDVVIGNPPYLDTKDFKEYTIKGFITIPTRNLYPLILERCLCLTSAKGRQGFIVPVSSIATEGYNSLQQILTNHKLFFSSFDDRPSHLFTHLDKNTVSILLISGDGKDHDYFSTRLCRWSVEERGSLFSILHYCKTPKAKLKGCLPKIGSNIEAGIWEKVFRKNKPLATSYPMKSDFLTYYSRKVNAFLQVLDFVPEVRDGKGKLRAPSEFKQLVFTSRDHAAAVFCCFNSSLFRWFIDVVTDGSHINRREIDNFPYDPEEITLRYPEMIPLAKSLSDNLRSNSQYRTMRYKHDALTVQCIIPKSSKPIINDIERILGKYYGLTDEELDFIINYDIKYRMGLSGEEHEKEEI